MIFEFDFSDLSYAHNLSSSKVLCKENKLDLYKIIYIKSGSSILKTMSGSKAVSEGDFIVRSPQHSFELIPSSNKQLDYYVIYFTDHLIPSDILIKIKRSPGVYNFQSNKIIELFSRFDWHIENSSGDSVVIKMLFRCVLTEILVYFSDYLRQQEALSTSEPHSIESVLNYIEQNIEKPLQIKDICNDLFFSKSYLCRLFHEKIGVPLILYIRTKRMNYANALIRAGISATEVAGLLGFTEYSSFYRQYEKIIGCPPSKTLCNDDKKGS